MSKYAAGTEVTVDRSQAEIRRTLKRYGITSSSFKETPGLASVEFVGHGRIVRFVIKLPDPGDRRFTRTPTGRDRSATAAQQAHEQAERQCWRALNLLIKAKLEAVEAGVQAFEDEFLPYTVLPDGRTVADAVRDPVAQAYADGQPRELLPTPRPAIGA